MNKRDLLTKLLMQGMEPSDPADAVGSIDHMPNEIHLAPLDEGQLPKIVLDSGTYEIDTSGDEPELVRVVDEEGDDG